MKDALGKSLEEIFKIVPGGCLVFFPSYKLMGKLCKRWHGTGQWSQLNEKKNLFVGEAFFVRLLTHYLYYASRNIPLEIPCEIVFILYLFHGISA